MDRLDRAGLRQDSQKRLQQESVLAYTGISHLSHEYSVLLHFEYCCNLNIMRIIKYPDYGGYHLYDPEPINTRLMAS